MAVQISPAHVATQRVGERFLDLEIPSAMVAAMDVTDESPPPELGITLPPLPAILLFPGDDKGPPFRYGGISLFRIDYASSRVARLVSVVRSWAAQAADLFDFGVPCVYCQP